MRESESVRARARETVCFCVFEGTCVYVCVCMCACALESMCAFVCVCVRVTGRVPCAASGRFMVTDDWALTPGALFSVLAPGPNDSNLGVSESSDSS